MNSLASLYKKIGIILGVIVVGAVGVVTFINERQSQASSATALTDASTNTSTDSSASNSSANSSKPSTPSAPVAVKTPPPATVPPKQYASVYKDGTYTATGSYGSPGGEDQLGVTVTLANDIITAVSVTPGANDRTSSKYQTRFISGYKQYVVGKNIANVNLSVVSGSSLTPIGFNNALSQIKSQAKA